MSLEQHRGSGPFDDTGDEVPEPSDEERAAWARVRRSATGMRHHEARSALATARKAARGGSPTGRDAVVARAEAEEWERVTGALAHHAGPYDPADDPFVQGEQDARDGRAPVAPRAQTLPHQG
ncbi:hypothetical protein [Streptomyces mirabilis]|uniref:Uncharacterized protein n=1 Tax=Streptomyces mirabilis TaxID=68239 RepID=A0A1I2HIX7_9ACTN|nr:hypothetical protein [Streptomyces mirabilis]SFF28716.1 hypothetical protein SAMN02787118_105141 [Streptomyces mirabilis]